jgi:hypothetical protein
MRQFGGMMRRIRISSFVVPWVLVTALTLSPVMAQNAETPKVRFAEPEGQRASLDTSIVGSSILLALPSRAPAPAVPEVKEPGKTKSTIVALLLISGAVAAILLLLPGGGGDKPAPPPAAVTPTGTVLVSGTPNVSTPNQ